MYAAMVQFVNPRLTIKINSASIAAGGKITASHTLSGPFNPAQPVSSAFTGCHITPSEVAHTLANTDSLGESCTVCHAAGAAFAESQVHAQY
jgi:Ni,Fe-hydrogenase III small subunit